MDRIKASCIQMDIEHCDKQKNIDMALSFARKAVSEGAELIVLPEVFSTGFCYEQIEHISEEHPYPTIEQLNEFSKESDCILIGSIIEKQQYNSNSIVYTNLGFCIESGELAGTYHKIHPFGREKEYFGVGDHISTIELEVSGLIIGLEICYELRFPEVARKLTLQGADLLVTIAEFPDPREQHWRNLSVARAIENQIPHIVCNCVGKDPYSTFPGASMIIDAWGNILEDARSEEGVIVHDIDLQQKDTVRSKIPVFEDRRPDIY
ncbi:MAG: nitrilase-related carbon-nitrogen hydrolase [Methanosarcinaceae archaeon]